VTSPPHAIVNPSRLADIDTQAAAARLMQVKVTGTAAV
jgi:hypothetical protein